MAIRQILSDLEGQTMEVTMEDKLITIHLEDLLKIADTPYAGMYQFDIPTAIKLVKELRKAIATIKNDSHA